MIDRVWRPTLVRRVFLSLLIASFIIWTALMALNLAETLSDSRTKEEVVNLTQYLADGLHRAGSDEAARAFVLGALGETRRDVYSWRNFRELKYEMRDSAGHALLSNMEDGEPALATAPGKVGQLQLVRRYLVARGDAPRWTVHVALPTHDLLGVMRDDWLPLTLNILLAFPLVFIPVWIAVSRGLGPLRQLSDRIAARGGDDLSPIGVDPTYAEITPLVTALDSLMLQLQNKISREHAFVQDAAHELRTPIAVISAQAHVLSLAASPHERLEAERQMDSAIARAAHLIHQLLALARLDEQPPEAASAIDVAQLVRTDLAQRVEAARVRALDLSFEAPDALMYALAPQAFRSVLHNLVDNALRYVQEGGRIVVELAARDGGLTLAVSDDGPGIDDAERELVFERFYRGAGNDAPGAGLGLAIARQAALGMHGTITLMPGWNGRGCRFVLTL